MRKSLIALPLVAAGLVFACGGSGRDGFSSDFQPTDPEADAGDTNVGDPGFKPGVGDNLDGEEDGGCASTSTSIARTPVVIEFVVDESGSMSGEKWTAQRDALLAVFDDMAKTPDQATYVGVQLFDDSPTTKVKPKPFTVTDHLDDLHTLIDKPTPHGGGTGSEDALQAGYDVVDNFQPPASAGLDTTNIKRVVIFMSDGAPSGGDSEKQRCEDMATDEFGAAPPAGPVLTFSIGVGKFPSDSPSTYDTAFMGRLAQAGGTAPAGCDPSSTEEPNICHFQVTPGGDVQATKDAFIAAINKIRSLSATCEFNFKLTKDADPNKVTVKLTDNAGKAHTVKKDPNNGWTYDNDKAPTKVILHGAACSASNGTVSGSVDVKFGCRGAQ